MELAQFFRQVQDSRRREGLRYPLEAMLWMVFLSIASGYQGYRKIHKFSKSNADFFIDYFGLKHGIPSHVSFRSLLMELDKKALASAFASTFGAQVDAGDWVAGDGQALRSTVTNAVTSAQSFSSVVSLYCQRTGLTLAVRDYQSSKSHEGFVLRELLDHLRDRGVIVTLDALHCQKKRPAPSF